MAPLVVGPGGALGAIARYLATDWMRTVALGNLRRAGGYALGSVTVGIIAVIAGVALATSIVQGRG